MQTVVDRFGAKATKAAMAHSMEKRIARLEAERVDAPRATKTFNVRFPDPPPCGVTVIAASGLCKAYGGPPVFEDVGFDLGRGERLLVLGLNGAGKTSLLRILAGETEADLGDVRASATTSTPATTPRSTTTCGPTSRCSTTSATRCRRASMLTETQLRGLLGMFGLSGEKVFQEAGTLSGGEKTKLALAMLMVGRNNLLLLDEPTNNLDPPSAASRSPTRSVDWPGAIVFVSHDTEFVERARADQGAADARRRRRLLQRGLARPREHRLIDHTDVVRSRSIQRRRLAVVVVAGSLLAGPVLAACAPGVDVAVEERARTPIADPSGDPSGDPAPTRPTASDSDPSGPVSTEPPAVPSTDSSTLAWGSCATFGIPSPSLLGTTHWECTTLDVPMDPFDPGADLPPVTLALTRHPATGTRLGTLVMNPGGPGGSGLDAAWGIRSAMPADILRAYDIVSWDPRGIGASTPPIDCGDDPDLESPEFMADCAQHTGELAAYLSGPYSAADLEAIRVALGEERLDYLGYSYGTIIGATFAADHPDQVGHFVLDGATDPLVGGPDGATDGGFPYYADDGVDAALDRFIELCDQSDACPMGDDTRSALDELRATAEGLPTDDFAGEPNAVDDETFDSVIQQRPHVRRRLAAAGHSTR